MDGQIYDFGVLFAFVLKIYKIVWGSDNFRRNYGAYRCQPSCSRVDLKPGARERARSRSAVCYVMGLIGPKCETFTTFQIRPMGLEHKCPNFPGLGAQRVGAPTPDTPRPGEIWALVRNIR